MILGLPLTYTANNDMVIGIALHMAIGSTIVETGRQRLITIKELHNRVYIHEPTPANNGPLQKVFVQQRPLQELTVREEDVLKLIAKGLTSSEIATRLSISENTVESYRKNLLLKMDARNLAELIKKASKLYWLE